MKTIKKDELYRSLSDFLKNKGVELKDGVYAQSIHRACDLLGDTINATQRTARKAKDEVDRKLDLLRQSIHEATAPKPPPVSPKASTGTGKKTRGRVSSVGKRASKAKK